MILPPALKRWGPPRGTGFLALLSPPPSTQVEGALLAKESVQATPTPLEGKEATPTEEEDTRPKVLIRGEWRKVPDGYPADASGQLECDQLFINDMSKLMAANGSQWQGCAPLVSLTPILVQSPSPVTQKRTRSTSVHSATTCSGCMFCGQYFPLPFGVPMMECIRLLLYWPHASALVAYNGGTSVGHGPVRTLFLEPEFVPSADTLDVRHAPVRNLFLGLILSLVPMTPCETLLYWPSPN